MLDVIKEVKLIEPELIEWRRTLHQIPEVHDELPETTGFIKEKLNDFGAAFRTYSNGGISVTVEGAQPGKTIAFRADMDGLPLTEETGLPFSSRHPGNMHACGHDAHAAMLLGAVKVLSAHRNELKGNVRFIFQPAEETTGGAKKMIDEGCLKNPDADKFISLHVGSLFPEVGNGCIGIKKGPIMSSVASFHVKVTGVGGHGARPHECVDPILISCEIIQSIQKLVSREINPTQGGVVTVGMIHGGTIINVIPEEVTFGGTVRALSKEISDLFEKRLTTMIPLIAQANGAKAEVQYEQYYPSTLNDSETTDFLAQSARKIVGAENVVEITEPSTGTEDVAYYINEVPGSFGILGSWKKHDDGVYYPHHNSKFHLDESVLWIGTAVFVQCALDYCNQ